MYVEYKYNIEMFGEQTSKGLSSESETEIPRTRRKGKVITNTKLELELCVQYLRRSTATIAQSNAKK